jgi:hypothetical protein
MTTSRNGMSRSDYTATEKLISQEARVGKQRAKHLKAERLADLSAQLAARFDPEDLELGAEMAQMEAEVRELDAKWRARTDAVLDRQGRPRRFRPQLHIWCSWSDRGENSSAARRAEFWQVGERAAEAEYQYAVLTYDTWELDTRRAITLGRVTSYEARRLIEALPSVEALMPPLSLKGLERLAQAQGARTPAEIMQFLRNDATAQLPASEAGQED